MTTKIRDFALQALERAKDKPKRAVGILMAMARKNPVLRERLLLLGADQLIRDNYRDARREAMTMARGRVFANIDNAEIGKRIAVRIARVAFWDSYTLFGQQPLRTATRKMLLESAVAREGQARGEMRNAAFERAVARRLANDSTTVEKSLDVDAVMKIASKYAGGNDE